jgi:hypothetical protein
VESLRGRSRREEGGGRAGAPVTRLRRTSSTLAAVSLRAAARSACHAPADCPGRPGLGPRQRSCTPPQQLLSRSGARRTAHTMGMHRHLRQQVATKQQQQQQQQQQQECGHDWGIIHACIGEVVANLRCPRAPRSGALLCAARASSCSTSYSSASSTRSSPTIDTIMCASRTHSLRRGLAVTAAVAPRSSRSSSPVQNGSVTEAPWVPQTSDSRGGMASTAHQYGEHGASTTPPLHSPGPRCCVP